MYDDMPTRPDQRRTAVYADEHGESATYPMRPHSTRADIPDTITMRSGTVLTLVTIIHSDVPDEPAGVPPHRLDRLAVISDRQARVRAWNAAHFGRAS